MNPTITRKTPLELNENLSRRYGCKVYLKREDLQVTRSYKIRGAYNKISSLPAERLQRGIACASAGNHAQGVAYSCSLLGINGHIFMPATTPSQKIQRVKQLGGSLIEISLVGNTYDEAAENARQFALEKNIELIPPFNDPKIIEGHSGIATEILEELQSVDYVFIPVGGGGLASGVAPVLAKAIPSAQLIGVEPQGAASMTAAFQHGKPCRLETIDPFVDGAAVSMVGDITYPICKDAGLKMHTVPEGRVCSTLLKLYNEEGILAEPAGVLSVAALDDFSEMLIGKTVVCIISGGNNDSNRIEEIKKLADHWEGLQHYLIIRFAHYPDGLKYFFSNILGSGDYVNRVEYQRRDHGRSTFALLGIRSENKEGYSRLLDRIKDGGMEYKEMTKEDFVFKYWV